MEDATRKKVLNFVNNLKEPMSIRKIAGILKMSSSTAQKYIDILTLQKKINVKDYGNIKLVSPIK